MQWSLGWRKSPASTKCFRLGKDNYPSAGVGRIIYLGRCRRCFIWIYVRDIASSNYWRQSRGPNSWWYICSSLGCRVECSSSHWSSDDLLWVSSYDRNSWIYACDCQYSHRSNNDYPRIQLAIHLSSCAMAMEKNQGRHKNSDQQSSRSRESCRFKSSSSFQKSLFMDLFMVLIPAIKKR